MFDWTRTKYPAMPEVTPPKEDDVNDDGYTIGSHGDRTILKVKCGYNTTTMSMVPSEVHRMIRLLKASMNQDPESEE